ncbi:P-loop containing nucleoside triphosphate hydrolase protein [Nemania serpens]|nr:P-loop containing nucleoside triphosphate hydrolase protein [Nemania serpens]
MASHMERITVAQLSIAVCVIILVHLWYRQQQQANPPPSEAPDPSLARPKKVEGSSSLTRSSRSSLEVLYPGPADPKKVEVDIVAVHGLGSNVDWSWTWQDKEGSRQPVHWLRDTDMLPRVVPHARIIAYNYESRWHVGAPRTRLELCGEEFGLLYADSTEQLKYLPACTVGFVPLGTPFRGTNMQNLATKVAWLLAPVGSHDGIIKELEQDGKHLADKVHTFSELRNRLDIPTTCFFELYDSDYGKKVGLAGWARGKVVEEESGHIPGWGRAQLYTDHFKLNKFAGPDDRSFQTVSEQLSNMCANRKSVIERRKQIARSPHFMVPFGRNRDFVGRGTILKQLLERIPPGADQDDCQRTAVEGLGGIGKTQVALEAAYQVHDAHPDCSIFWVPAVDLTSFENAYREIGKLLSIPGIDDDKADVKALVKTNLEHAHNSSWLLIIDNADDLDMLFQDAKLANSLLPFSRQGSILFTTRSHQVAVQLDIPQTNIIAVQEMDDAEATRLLRIGLKKSQIGDAESIKHLLRFLANLPLAIKQASAYMAFNTNVTVSQYLEFCESSNVDLIYLLSKEFEDRYRYQGYARTQNPVATTWLISFKRISQHNPQAADYLKFICFLAEKDIPQSLLPPMSKIQTAEAIGSLKAYAFILEHDTPDSFDIHRLVRLVMRSWLREKGEWEEWTIKMEIPVFFLTLLKAIRFLENITKQNGYIGKH